MKKAALIILGSILLSSSAFCAGPDFNSMINNGVEAQQALRKTLQGRVGDPQKELKQRDAQVFRIANETGHAIPQNLTITSAQRDLSTSDEEFIDDELIGISELQ